MSELHGDDSRGVRAESGEGEGGSGDGVHFRLPPSSLRLTQLESVVGAPVVLGIIIGVAQFPFIPEWLDANLVIICLLVLAGSAFGIFVWAPVLHSRYLVSMYAERLVVSEGFLLARRATAISRDSILKLQLGQGPILKRFGLTNVVIHTIAGTHNVGMVDSRQKALIENFVRSGLS